MDYLFILFYLFCFYYSFIHQLFSFLCPNQGTPLPTFRTEIYHLFLRNRKNCNHMILICGYSEENSSAEV